MRRFAATVTIITASDGERVHGMTATAVTSLSLEPPALLVCINNSTLLHDIMFRARRFCVNVLHADQSGLSSVFSGAVAPEERFSHGTWVTSEDGIPGLVDAQATLFCRKSAAVPFGTHTIIVGTVEEIGVREAIAPLVYQDGTYCAAGQHVAASIHPQTAAA